MKFSNSLTYQNIRIIFIFLAVFFITFFCYQNTLNNGFVWDDISYIVENTYITRLSWDNIYWMFTNFYISNWHPLTWLSLAFDYALFGHTPWGYHLSNMILHSLNSVLVFVLSAVLIKIKNSSRLKISFSDILADKRLLLASWIAAVLFGIHPQHVESVAWITERKDVLSMFFILLTLLTYIAYAKTSARRTLYYILCLFLFTLALMAKPMAVTIPVVLLLLDVYPLQRTILTGTTSTIDNFYCVSWKFLLLEKLPFFLFSFFVIALTILAQTEAMVDLDRYSIEIRLLNTFNSIILYISKFLFPIYLHPFYGYKPDLSNIKDYMPLIAFFLITAVCIYLWLKKNYYPLIIWLFYLITLSPVIGIIQVGLQSSADRYAYLPTIPFYIVVGSLVSHLVYIPAQKTKLITQFSVLIFLILVSGALFFKTQQQIPIWKNDLSFWNYVVHMDPENGRAQCNLGRAEYSFGRYANAIEHFGIANSKNSLFLQDLLLWSESFLKEKQPELALEIYSNIINSPVEIDNNEKSCIYYNIGCIHLLNYNPTDAKVFFKSVQTNTPLYQKAQDILSYIDESDNLKTIHTRPLCQYCF